jgi:DNA excision repair protein ERCC-2
LKLDIEVSAKSQINEGNQNAYELPKGIYTLADLRAIGQRDNVCPYFLARTYASQADVLLCHQQFVLDPRFRNILPTDADAIVVFDECLEIENDCIDTMSLHMNKHMLD